MVQIPSRDRIEALDTQRLLHRTQTQDRAKSEPIGTSRKLLQGRRRIGSARGEPRLEEVVAALLDNESICSFPGLMPALPSGPKRMHGTTGQLLQVLTRPLCSIAQCRKIKFSVIYSVLCQRRR